MEKDLDDRLVSKKNAEGRNLKLSKERHYEERKRNLKESITKERKKG